jgi:hypothetical protein
MTDLTLDFIAKSKILLEVDDIGQFAVQNCSFTCTRARDFDGQMASPARFNEIRLVLEDDDKILDMLGWMAGNTLKSGKIDFKLRMENKIRKTLTFTDAFIFDYQESCDEGGVATITFAISASTVKFGDKAEFVNDWIPDSTD